ncbi:MAG: LamG-like jellyroll fold domain-containing protein [Bacteroidales bacterium]
MKKQIIFISSLLLVITLISGITSCKKNSDTAAFNVTSITAGDIDLNGSVSPTNVPPNPTIIAIFNAAVTPASVNNAITLIRLYDNVSIPLTITVTGSIVTIVPTSGLGTGSLYSLNFSSAVSSTDGQALPVVKRSFTTSGPFVPDGMVAYYTFENTAADALNHYNPIPGGVIDMTYATSFTPAAGMAGKFNGTSTLIEIGKGDSLMLTSDFTIYFWVKADTTKHGQFVMGLAGWYGFQFEMGDNYSWCKLAAQYSLSATTSASQDLFFNGTETTASWKGYTFCKDLTASGGVQYFLAGKWANVACIFNSSTKVATMYINSQMMKQQDYNLYDPPITTANGLRYNGYPGNKQFVFGFIQDKNDPTIADDWAKYDNPANKHFKGLLDNVRIFHKALSEQEIQMMYNSEKP